METGDRPDRDAFPRGLGAGNDHAAPHATSRGRDAPTPEDLEILAHLRPLVEVMDALHALSVAHGLIRLDPARATTRVADAIASLEAAIPHLRSGLSRLSDAVGPADGEDAPGPKPHRVLVCEDDASVRLLLLTLFGADPRFEVVAAVPDAEAAIEQVARERPDIVLLDLAMPGIGGLAAIRPIREQAPDCRVIVLSGLDRPQAAEQALREGAAAFILKGDDVGGLLDEVSGVMARSRRAASSPVAPVIDLPAWRRDEELWEREM